MLCVCCLNEAILYTLPLSKVVFARVQCTFSPHLFFLYFLCRRRRQRARRREGFSCIGARGNGSREMKESNSVMSPEIHKSIKGIDSPSCHASSVDVGSRLKSRRRANVR